MGKPLAAETKERIAATLRGRPKTGAHKRALRDAGLRYWAGAGKTERKDHWANRER